MQRDIDSDSDSSFCPPNLQVGPEWPEMSREDGVASRQIGTTLGNPNVCAQPQDVPPLKKIQPGVTIHGTVIRERRLFHDNFYYNMETTGADPVPLLFAQKTLLGYKIYQLEAGDINRKRVIGRVRSDFRGLNYVLKQEGSKKVVVKYQDIKFFRKTPRKFVAFYHNLDATNPANTVRGENMAISEGMCIFLNKAPLFHNETGSYMLNFNGRVTIPSTKNFQLISPNHASHILLTFGRRSENSFVVDFSYPLNALEAFFFSIAALDIKLVC